LWEGFVGDVDDELLFYGDPASGISLLGTGDIIDANGVSVGGLFAIEDLYKRGNGLADLVSGETVDGKPGVMAQDATKSNLLLLREFVVWDLPRSKALVDVFIERERTVLDQVKRSGRSYGFADGARLKRILVVTGVDEPGSVTP
jgi:hypothetical protein